MSGESGAVTVDGSLMYGAQAVTGVNGAVTVGRRASYGTQAVTGVAL